jgi:hypothetical protein
MFGVNVNEKKQAKILTEVYKIFILEKKSSIDVKDILQIINKFFIFDFNELKYSVRNDKKLRFIFSEDLCTLKLRKNG